MKEQNTDDLADLMRELGEKIVVSTSNFWAQASYCDDKGFFSVRDFGSWVIPDDEPQDEEDCDWKVPTKETDMKLLEIVDEFCSVHPNLDIHISAGEKNYFNFQCKFKDKKQSIQKDYDLDL